MPRRSRSGAGRVGRRFRGAESSLCDEARSAVERLHRVALAGDTPRAQLAMLDDRAFLEHYLSISNPAVFTVPTHADFVRCLATRARNLVWKIGSDGPPPLPSKKRPVRPRCPATALRDACSSSDALERLIHDATYWPGLAKLKREGALRAVRSIDDVCTASWFARRRAVA